MSRGICAPSTTRSQFDRAMMMFNSFGYFPDDENLPGAAEHSRALKPGGLLGFDIANRDGVLNDFHPHYVSEKEGNLMINRFSFDVHDRTAAQRPHHHPGWRSQGPPLLHPPVFDYRNPRAAGPGRAGVWKPSMPNGTASPLQMDSPSMVVVARKTVNPLRVKFPVL